MSYYIVNRAVSAREYPSSDTGKSVTKLAAGTLVECVGDGSFTNTSLNKTYLPILVDGTVRWVHDAYLVAVTNGQAAAIRHGLSMVGVNNRAKAIAWYNSTDSGKADPKPTTEAHCTVGALWGVCQGTNLGSLISRTAAKLETKARKKGIWHSKSGSYSPKPGDIVQFKADGKSAATHSELLVLKYGTTLYTIDYNNDKYGKRRTRKTTDSYTYGYVEISY